MKSRGNSLRLGWSIVRTIGLCAAIAFVISFASPTDDDLQQECLGRTRQHAARLAKGSHRNTESKQVVAAQVAPVVHIRTKPTRDRCSIATTTFLHVKGAILAHQNGDRSPPVTAL